MKFLIINELYMVSSDLWINIDSRLEELFMMISENNFCCSFRYDCSWHHSTISGQGKTNIFLILW